MRDARRTRGRRGLRGGGGGKVDARCFLDDLRAFAVNANQWTTAAGIFMAKDGVIRGGTFHGEMNRCTVS